MAQDVADPGSVGSKQATQRELAEALWPDKSLYAAVVLFLAGLVGILTWLIDVTVGLAYSARGATVFAYVPTWSIAVLSAAAVTFATVALRKRSTMWTVAGIVCAFTSVGFAGTNVVLALFSLAFVGRARQENEDHDPATRILTADMWPDKALAASLLLVVGSVITVAWGVAVAADLVTYEGYIGGRVLFGLGAALVGVVGLRSAHRLYLQRRPGPAILGALVMGAAGALWVIGPILALAAVTLAALGMREHEFEAASSAHA